MSNARVSVSIAIGIAAALIVLAFVVAPRACEGGLEVYLWCGVVALLFLLALPFIHRIGNSLAVRAAVAFGFLFFGAGAWLVGLFAANVRFICGLGYL